MSHSPLVTFVIPSFNHACYVESAIQSVIDQSYENIELLIIDDGSSDDSVAIIDRLVPLCKTRFCRFEFLKQENTGLTSVLNKALQWANGEYFCGIASDDINFNIKTELLVEHLENFSLDAVCGGYVEIDHLGNRSRLFSPNMSHCNFDDILFRRAQLYAPSALFRTEALKYIGGYDSNLVAEDRDIWLSLAHNGFLIGTIPEAVTFYRRHNDNLSGFTRKMIESRLAVYQKYDGYPGINEVRARDLLGAAKEAGRDDFFLSFHYIRCAYSFSRRYVLSWKGLKVVLTVFYSRLISF